MIIYFKTFLLTFALILGFFLLTFSFILGFFSIIVHVQPLSLCDPSLKVFAPSQSPTSTPWCFVWFIVGSIFTRPHDVRQLFW